MSVVSRFPDTHIGEITSSFFLMTFLQIMGRSHICFSVVVRVIPGPPRSFEDVREWHCKDMDQLSWHSWMQLLGLMDLKIPRSLRQSLSQCLAGSFPLSPEAWNTLLMKTDIEKALSTLALSVPYVTKSLSLFSNGPTFSLFSLYC